MSSTYMRWSDQEAQNWQFNAIEIVEYLLANGYCRTTMGNACNWGIGGGSAGA